MAWRATSAAAAPTSAFAARSTWQPDSRVKEGEMNDEIRITNGERNPKSEVNRRDFIKVFSLAGGGLVLGVYLPGLAGRAGAAQQASQTFAPNAFVRIGADDIVTVIVNHSEMGQGPYTSIPMVVAEELDADWSKVRFEAAPD